MRITIEMHDSLQRFNRNGQRRCVLNVADGTTVRDLLQQLGMDLNEPWNAGLDGKLAGPLDPVRDGSLLVVFTPIAGG